MAGRRVPHLDADSGPLPGTVFGLIGLERHRKPLPLRHDPDGGVPHPDGGPTRVVEWARHGASAPRHDDRHEGIGRPRLGDGEFERRRALGDPHPPLLDQPFPLHRDPRLGIGERRGKEHGGGVAHRVAGLVGDDVHLELRFVAPGYPARPGGPAVEAGDHLATGPVLGPELDRVAARECRIHAAERIAGRGGHTAAAHRVAHPLAHQLAPAILLPAHLVPLAPDQHAAHLDPVEPPPVRLDRDNPDALRRAGLPEIRFSLRLGPEVELGGMHQRTGAGVHGLPVHVGHQRLDSGARGAALLYQLERRPDGEMPGAIECVHPALAHGSAILRLHLFPPPPLGSDKKTVGVGDVGAPGREGGLPDRPGDLGPPHRRAEEVARAEGRGERVAVEPRCVVGDQVHQELGGTVLRHPIEGVGHLLPLALALEADADVIVSQRRRAGQPHRLLHRAEGGGSQDRLPEHSLITILERHLHRVAARRRFERSEQSGPHDRLGVDRVSRPVDATLGEDRGRGRKTLLPVGGGHVESPG